MTLLLFIFAEIKRIEIFLHYLHVHIKQRQNVNCWSCLSTLDEWKWQVCINLIETLTRFDDEEEWPWLLHFVDTQIALKWNLSSVRAVISPKQSHFLICEILINLRTEYGQDIIFFQHIIRLSSILHFIHWSLHKNAANVTGNVCCGKKGFVVRIDIKENSKLVWTDVVHDGRNWVN